MQIKYNARWYVDPTVAHADGQTLGFPMFQTTGPVAVAYFPDLEEAQWAVHKLNTGRRLVATIENLLNHDEWLSNNPNGLVEEVLLTLIEFKKLDR